MQPELPFDGLPHFGKPARPVYVPPPIDERALRIKKIKETARTSFSWIVWLAVLAKQIYDVLKGVWVLLSILAIMIGAAWYYVTGKKEAEPVRPGIGGWQTDTFREK